MSLQKMKCPKCGDLIEFKEGKLKRTSSYYDCLRRCEKCQLGFSNSKSKPTLIYKDLRNNIPEFLHQDVEYTLSHSLNKRSRGSKRNRFAFSTSEDALTWSFFSYFVFKNRLFELLKLLNIDSIESDFEIYLWGVNISSKIIETELYQKLINASDSFHEDDSKRSEPDVIIKLTDKIIFIEVKYNSPNDIQKNTDKFKKYMIPNVDIEAISNNGHYELYRNWAFASKLSNGGKFELINLGFSKLFEGKKQIALQEFEEIIKTSNGKFVRLTWEHIIDKINDSDFDRWYKDYLMNKLKPAANTA